MKDFSISIDNLFDPKELVVIFNPDQKEWVLGIFHSVNPVELSIQPQEDGRLQIILAAPPYHQEDVRLIYRMLCESYHLK
jgi:hypothetical protein